ncbi:hypothetical protein K432DRAFT_444231 [Lepidopterella palustris CBS 459.81]|uniref:RRM domain-containing protein n=1 Tax=Lepidopterella palustris CBS 459.81 TaxID=1314670 RepID=A0A8E2E7R8_9PEZI|nr:hypothetical protein K432DRAFT_444231 [Lepidopterella palustris CBS 459.81]
MATTVHVENISTQTSEKEVRDFFSFCGKISTLSITPTGSGSQSATVTFEKETAAKTALLLDNTTLGPSQVQVSSAKSIDELAGANVATEETTKDSHDVEQEDKPRSRIIAEYLAHGYIISDKAIERAIQLDQQHGISTRFSNALKTFDGKFHATERAMTMDSKLGVSDKAAAGWRGMHSYFEKALGTPTGQKVRQFYLTGNKQVIDVHNEARHLANLKTGKQSQTAAAFSGEFGSTSASGEKMPSVEEAGVEQVPGTDGKTKCNCGAMAEKCPCPPGKCACNSCAKNVDAGISEKTSTSTSV